MSAAATTRAAGDRRRLAVYYMCPAGRRLLFVLADPTDDEVDHYLDVGTEISAGRVRGWVGLVGFHLIDPDDGDLGAVDMRLVDATGIRTVRTEHHTEPDQLPFPEVHPCRTSSH